MFMDKIKSLLGLKKKSDRSFSCRKCGAVSSKKGNLCKPKKVKDEE